MCWIRALHSCIIIILICFGSLDLWSLRKNIKWRSIGERKTLASIWQHSLAVSQNILPRLLIRWQAKEESWGERKVGRSSSYSKAYWGMSVCLEKNERFQFLSAVFPLSTLLLFSPSLPKYSLPNFLNV